ncbi:MAG: hypothetical protein RL557_646 [archaeon]|jgi:hypothetical protein
MKNVWRGWIIDKSLHDLSVLALMNVIKSHEERNSQGSQLQIWNLRTVEIDDEEIKNISNIIEKNIKKGYYAHFTNGKRLLIIFSEKSFIIKVDKVGKDKGNGITSFVAASHDKKLWKTAFEYGTEKGKVDSRYLLDVH